MKSDGADNKELSPARLLASILILLLGSAQLSGAVLQKQSADLMKEYLDTDRHVYAALERVPVRHWGDRSLAAQFWRLRDVD